VDQNIKFVLFPLPKIVKLRDRVVI